MTTEGARALFKKLDEEEEPPVENKMALSRLGADSVVNDCYSVS